MGSVSHKTNPTGALTLDRRLVRVRLERAPVPTFTLVSHSLGDAGLPNGLDVVLTAYAGTNRSRHILGRTGGPLNQNPIEAPEMDCSAPFTFRITFTNPGDPRIIALIEGIRPSVDGDMESLIPMERVDLGEEVWKLHLDNHSGPILQINENVFPTTSGAEGYLPFSAFVLPEVLRQCIGKLCRERELLEGDSAWAAWKPLVESLGIEFPDDPDDPRQVSEIADRMVYSFCSDPRMRFAAKLQTILSSVETGA